MDQERDISRRGIMLVLSSPSGAGKTTLTRNLLEQENTRPVSSTVDLGDDAGAAAERDRRRALSFHDQAPVRERCATAANCSNGPRCTAISTARRASRWRRRSPPAATCCSTSTGRARASCSRRCATTWSRVFVLPPSADELKARLERRAEDSRDDHRAAAAERDRGNLALAANTTTSWSTAISTRASRGCARS